VAKLAVAEMDNEDEKARKALYADADDADDDDDDDDDDKNDVEDQEDNISSEEECGKFYFVNVSIVVVLNHLQLATKLKVVYLELSLPNRQHIEESV